MGMITVETTERVFTYPSRKAWFEIHDTGLLLVKEGEHPVAAFAPGGWLNAQHTKKKLR
jgi:ADP-ribose pyrophosphatase YjhB (NUDIX family)